MLLCTIGTFRSGALAQALFHLRVVNALEITARKLAVQRPDAACRPAKHVDEYQLIMVQEKKPGNQG
jgi:hypothetical protein